MFEKIKINMQELAKEVVDEFSFLIQDTGLTMTDTEYDRYQSYLWNYYLSLCKDKLAPVIPAFITFEEELDSYVRVEIHKRITNLIENTEKEDLEMTKQEFREYEVTEDGS